MKQSSKNRFNWSRLIPVVILLAGLIAFYVFDLYRFFSFSELANQHAALKAWQASHPLLIVLIFLAIYVVAVAFSFPGATLLTLIAGYLFGPVFGTLYVIVAATIGAAIIFLAARYAFADLFSEKAGKWLKKMEKGFKEDAFSYLLVLRLIPLFPFWLVNIVPGLLGVNLRTFTLATFIGIIPGTAVYAAVGNGLSSIFERGETPDFGIIFEPQILIPLLALGVLSLVPVIYKRFKRKSS